MPASSSISLRQLEYFVAVAEHDTVAAASRATMVSQSAVSVAVSQLEARLGVDLFHREPSKRLVLTPAGRRLLADARRVLSQVDDLTATAQDLGESLEGSLVVGCAETLTPYVLPAILGDFSRVHPSLDLDLVEGSVEEVRKYLAEAVCEVAITYWPAPAAGFTPTPLYTVRPHVILPAEHRLSGQEAIRLADLQDDRMILLDSPPSAELFLAILADVGFAPKSVKRTSNMDTLRALVAAGAGYAPLLNRHVATRDVNGRPFAAVSILDQVTSVGVYVVAPTHGHVTRRARTFMEFCVEHFRLMQ